MNTVFLNFLSNHWPHSSPVSIFLTESTPLSTDKGQKHSAVRIKDGDFESPLHERNLQSWIPRIWRIIFCCNFHIDNSIFNAEHVWYNKLPIICRQCRKFCEISFFTTDFPHRSWTRDYKNTWERRTFGTRRFTVRTRTCQKQFFQGTWQARAFLFASDTGAPCLGGIHIVHSLKLTNVQCTETWVLPRPRVVVAEQRRNNACWPTTAASCACHSASWRTNEPDTWSPESTTRSGRSVWTSDHQ